MQSIKLLCYICTVSMDAHICARSWFYTHVHRYFIKCRHTHPTRCLLFMCVCL